MLFQNIANDSRLEETYYRASQGEQESQQGQEGVDQQLLGCLGSRQLGPHSAWHAFAGCAGRAELISTSFGSLKSLTRIVFGRGCGRAMSGGRLVCFRSVKKSQSMLLLCTSVAKSSNQYLNE